MLRNSLAMAAAFLLLMAALGPAAGACTIAGATGSLFAKDGCCYECPMYAWDPPVLHVDAAGVMKCDSKGMGAQTGQTDGGLYLIQC